MTQLKKIKQELNKIQALKRSGKIIKRGYDFAKEQMEKEQRLKRELEALMLTNK